MLDEATAALEQMPAKMKEKLSLREAVDVLREKITAALDKGYSYEDIAGMLEAQGITIAPSSLKHYLARSNRQMKVDTGSQTKRKRTAKMTETEAEDLTEPASAIEVEPDVEAAPKRRGRRPASEAASATKTTRTTAARTKSVSTATGTRKRRGQA